MKLYFLVLLGLLSQNLLAAEPPSCALFANPTSVTAGETVALSLFTFGSVTTASIEGKSVPIGGGEIKVVAAGSGIVVAKGKVIGLGGSFECPTKYSVISNPIVGVKPALALRAANCAVCHVQVHSNFVVDFGFKDPYYLGLPAAPSLTGVYGLITDRMWRKKYRHASRPGPGTNNWSDSTFQGKILIPKGTTVPPNDFIEETTVEGFLKNSVINQTVEVKEAQKIYIGAPTQQDILKAAGQFPVAHPDWKYIPNQGSSLQFSGLVSSGTYYKNSGDIVCDGDLVIKDKTLSLTNLNLKTINGCRIYLAGKSAVIHGPITYINKTANSNLQITSSRAILMGMGDGAQQLIACLGTTASDQCRLIEEQDVSGMYTRAFPSAATAKMHQRQIYDEHRTISGVLDAEAEPNGREVAFDRLLLNAPIIHSRYNGDFQGVIVAEFFLPSLGTFIFKHDVVFDAVPILPLISSSTYFDLKM